MKDEFENENKGEKSSSLPNNIESGEKKYKTNGKPRNIKVADVLRKKGRGLLLLLYIKTKF